ncbi:MAG: hypothetical protein L0338_30890 [Acidobacteria bacterium]|nr:hypothetical protein [Acidobacteriota bacterium]
MTASLTAEVLQDDLAVSLARAVAAANRRARELGVDVLQNLVTITQRKLNDEFLWRINYDALEYVARRGGDLIIDVDQTSADIKRVLRGQ